MTQLYAALTDALTGPYSNGALANLAALALGVFCAVPFIGVVHLLRRWMK